MSIALDDPAVARTLDRLHGAARGDWIHFLRVLPGMVSGMLRGQTLMKTLTPAQLKDVYIPVSRPAGRFLYATARAIRATCVVEFGTSFGISTIYLAAALRDEGRGTVFTTEIEPSKCRAAERNLREAGVADHAQVLEGDALETLQSVRGPIDLVFLDGWKDLYRPVLGLLRPRLRPTAVVLADNVNMRDAQPYLEVVRAAGSGFVSSTLFSGRMEHSVLAG